MGAENGGESKPARMNHPLFFARADLKSPRRLSSARMPTTRRRCRLAVLSRAGCEWRQGSLFAATFLIDDGVLMAPPPRLYDHLLCGCNADRFHRLILNNRMEPSKLAAIHLWQLWKVRRFNAASKVAREDSLMRLFLELQIWWIELFQFFVSIPPVLVYIYICF